MTTLYRLFRMVVVYGVGTVISLVLENKAEFQKKWQSKVT